MAPVMLPVYTKQRAGVFLFPATDAAGDQAPATLRLTGKPRLADDTTAITTQRTFPCQFFRFQPEHKKAAGFYPCGFTSSPVKRSAAGNAPVHPRGRRKRLAQTTLAFLDFRLDRLQNTRPTDRHSLSTAAATGYTARNDGGIER